MRQFMTIVEGISVHHAFHITLARNVGRIMEEGLVPRVGPRSRRLKEPKAAVYLFPTISDVETAYEHWLSEEWNENTKLALLKVTIPHTFEVFSDAPFECHVYEPIPPACISVQSMDLGSELGFDHLDNPK